MNQGELGIFINLIGSNASRVSSVIRKNLASRKKVSEMILNQPHSVTVKASGRGYRRRGFIGGEEFTLKRVYLGKTGNSIFCFSAKMPATGESFNAEMEGSVCIEKLDGFTDYMVDLFEDCADIVRASGDDTIIDVMNADRKRREKKIVDDIDKAHRKEKLKMEKEKKYAEIGYGSW